MLDWMKTTVLNGYGNIKPHHLDLIRLSDDPDEIADGIEKHFHQSKSLENF
jgi:hypothetical protein